MIRALAVAAAALALAWPAWADELVCDQCVNTGDIAKNAVNSARIKNGTVTLKDLAPEVLDKFAGSGGSSGKYEFVGYSNDDVNGSVGLEAMTNKCQNVFGGEARMANTKELILSPKANLNVPGKDAWINAYIVGVGSDGLAMDYSVLSGTVDDLVCGGGWSSSNVSDTGLLVFGKSSLTLSMCNAKHSVACSAPGQ